MGAFTPPQRSAQRLPADRRWLVSVSVCMRTQPRHIAGLQIIRECRMRAAILIAIANDAPELENQLLYVAEKWLTLAPLREQLNAQFVVSAFKVPCPRSNSS